MLVLLFLSGPIRLEGTTNEKIGTASTTPTLPASVRQQLIDAFGTDSIMLAIASCESHFRQFHSDGSVYKGKINPHDIGVFQISETYWLDVLNKLGYNIYTLDGNIKMAEYIYEHNGTTPWNWSKKCWSVLGVSESKKG